MKAGNFERGDVVWWLGRPCIVLEPDQTIVIGHWGETRLGCVLLVGTEKRLVKYNDLEGAESLGFHKYEDQSGHVC